MISQNKITLAGLVACTLFSTIHPQQLTEEQRIALLPAITLQMRNNGLVQTRFAKLFSEENYGLWIALDSQNNSLHCKVIQKEDGPTMIDVNKVTKQLTSFIKANENSIKAYLSDIINFQTAKHYLDLLKNYFQDTSIPTIRDLNTQLLKMGLKPEVLGEKNMYAEANFTKKLRQDLFQIDNKINIWQKKYNISPQNMQEINHVYQTLQKYIDTHPINSSHISNSFSMSFDLFDPTNIDTAVQFEQQKPYTIQFAQINNVFIRKLTKKFNTAAEYKTTISAFFYLPPFAEFYGNTESIDQLKEKLKTISSFLKEHKQDSLFTPDAHEKIKEKANEVVSGIIAQIKKIQQLINTQIDGICERLKAVF